MAPFGRAELFAALSQYNRGTWPAQLVAFAIAVACILMLVEGRGASRAIGFGLGLVWAWMALAFYVVYLTPVTSLAWLFAGAFLAGASAFAERAGDGRLVFEPKTGLRGALGLVLMLYGLVGYPLVASLSGQSLFEMATVGLPSPTTIFTLGLLFFARRPFPLGILIVPLAWCVVGTVSAVSLRILPDLALPVAGVVTAAFLLGRSGPMPAANGGHA